MPTNYYNILAESLNKKYLKEAWSDSMPDWMKPRMNATAMFSDSRTQTKTARHMGLGDTPPSYFDPGYNKMVNAIKKKGGGSTYDNAHYVQPRDWSRTGGDNIYREFQRAGIDLQKVKFIEGPKPEKKSDPRIQPPNIGIWDIPSTGQIYAKGINDLETVTGNAYSDDGHNYSGCRFESLPMKALREISDHFCYIDGSNIPTFDYYSQNNERYNTRKWMMKNGNKQDQYNAFGSRKPQSNRDKSGYLVIPTAEKYADEVAARKGRGYAKKLEQFEADLISLRQEIVSALNRSSLATDSDVDNVHDATNYLSHAISYYNIILDSVKAALYKYQNNTNNTQFLNEVAYIVSPDNSYVRDYQNYLRRARNEIKDLEGTVLDF